MKAAPLALALLLVAGALALALPSTGLVALLSPADERALPAPPELRLRAPLSGQGGEGPWLVAGEALSTSGRVTDVQVRVDGGPWQSVPDAPRGQSAVPFARALELARGDRLVEARAYDGDAFSLTQRALVRPGAPTVRVASPTPGASVAAGDLLVAGTVEGDARSVEIERDGERTRAVMDGAAWSARLFLPPGEHVLRIQAIGDPPSLPVVLRVVAGAPAPPVLTLTRPQEGAAVGSAGEAACPGCLLFAGGAPGAVSVRATLDGLPAGEATLAPGGAWTFPLAVAQLGNGEHVAGFRAFDARGQTSVEQQVRFLARTPREVRIEGDAAPAPTGTPLAFRLAGDGLLDARWSLDGEPAGEGLSFAATLARGGDHLLSVAATDEAGRVATAILPLHAYNRAPTVVLERVLDPTSAFVVLEALSEDPDGRIVAYEWDFGDGRRERTRAPDVRHAYPGKGAYAATVTAYDDLGAASAATLEVEVANMPAVANFTWTPEAPTILSTVMLHDATIDPEGRPLRALRWSFPDGAESGEVAPTLRFAARGDHVVALRVTDEEGAQSVVARTIHVANIEPAARLSHDPPLPQSGQHVLFTDASVDPDGPLVQWRWEFGDGASAGTRHAAHAYAAPGDYLVNLTVTDDMQATNRTQLLVRVSDAPPDVRAVVAEPAFPLAQQEVRLRALAGDREGGALFALWDFGDGAQANASEPVHRYARSGLYHGRVLVYDEAGLSTAFPFAIAVANAPPSVSLALADGGYAQYPTLLAASAADPDGAIATYRIDADGDGRWDCEGAEPTCAFTFESPGAYAATAMVEDDEGAIAQSSLLLDVAAPASGLAPPRVRVELPATGARLAEEILVAGTASGAHPIVRVELQARSGAWSYSGGREPWLLAEGTSAWRAALSTRALPDGEIELVVRATDAVGGVGFARVPISVANGPRPSEVAVRLLDLPTELRDDALVHGVAYHPEGITLVRWRVDEGAWQTIADAPFAFTLPLDRDALAPGPHTLRVDAYRGLVDNASLVQGFVVPDEAPALVVDEAPPSIAYGLLAASGRVDGVGRAQWRLDHGLWRDLPPSATWTLSEETAGWPEGPHVVSLRAVSPDARLRSETRVYEVEVVNPPFASTGSPAAEQEAARQETPLPFPFVAVAAAALLARRFGPLSPRP